MRRSTSPPCEALKGFTNALRTEVEKSGLSVSLVILGPVESSYWEHNPGSRERVPKGIKTITTEEAAGDDRRRDRAEQTQHHTPRDLSPSVRNGSNRVCRARIGSLGRGRGSNSFNVWLLVGARRL